MGSNIVIVTFEDMETAGQVLKSIEAMDKENLVALKDAAVLVKDENGKVEVKETEDVSTRRGVVTGGTLGLIVGLIVGGPVGGLVVGGALGALAAKKIDLGISDDKIVAFEEEMKNGTSSLFLQFTSAEKKEWLIALVRDSGGKIVEIELSDDAELDINEHLTDYTGRH